MSTFSATCDALIADLTANVSGLAAATLHRYEAWFPEELANDGNRHLAVYPASDAFDVPSTQDAPIGEHWREQVFVILVWEQSGTESPRQVSDEAGAATFLDLYEAVLARLYVDANQAGMAGTWKQWFMGAEVPDRSAQVRWFRMAVKAHRILNFT